MGSERGADPRGPMDSPPGPRDGAGGPAGGRPSLSICIPTLNRCRFLEETLESIRPQLAGREGQVEICVYDSSSDGTGEMVARRRAQGMPISYTHDPVRRGVDRSILASIAMARGRYAWTLGDDDIIEPGGVAAVLAAIEARPGLAFIQLNKYAYSKDMARRWPGAPPVGAGRYAHDQPFEGAESIKAFFSAFFYDLSFMSTQVVDKDLFERTLSAEPDIGRWCRDYAEGYVVSRMLLAQPHALFIAAPHVGNRTENETTLSVKSEAGGSGAIARMDRASGENFKDIADALLRPFDAATYRATLDLIVRYHVRAQMMSLHLADMPLSKRMAIWRRTHELFGSVPSFWTHALPFMLIPTPLYRLMRALNQKVVKPARGAQILKGGDEVKP